MGTALGYLVGGQLGQLFGWRHPFLAASIPGFVLAALLLLVPEPVRGSQDHLERGTHLGLLRNRAYWCCTLGMAMMTFAVGGLQVWMPTFLLRIRGVPLAHANTLSGGMTLAAGLVATPIGGWLGDRLLRRSAGAQFQMSAIGMTLALPAMAVAVNMFTIHLLGDAFSSTLIGWISDRSNLQTGFASTLVAVALSAAILFYGMRFAPPVKAEAP